jgi:hypothetical protein
MSSEMALAASGIGLFAQLAMGHFVADFGLQSDRMAVEKCPGKDHTLPWGWWLLAHTGIHAFFVTWITGLVWLGLAEWVIHALIDQGKCRHRYGLGVDQFLHIACKLLWVLILMGTGALGPGSLGLGSVRLLP